MIKALKKGNFRWRKKFRYLPNRQQLIDEIGIEWLANRFYAAIWRHNATSNNLEMMRIRSHEFVFIINKSIHQYTLEIIQYEKVV